MPSMPWMKFYINDYLADTIHLEAEEHGAYLMLIFTYWRDRKPLRATPEELAARARVPLARWPLVEPRVRPFFVERDGHWFHNRIELELQKALDKSEANSRAGLESARRRKASGDSTDVQHPSSVCSTDVLPRASESASVSDPSSVSTSNTEKLLTTKSRTCVEIRPSTSQQKFRAFWAMWSAVRGTHNEDRACRAWISCVPDEEADACLACAASYLAGPGSRNDGGYNPDTFLFTLSETHFRDTWGQRAPPVEKTRAALGEFRERIAREALQRNGT